MFVNINIFKFFYYTVTEVERLDIVYRKQEGREVCKINQNVRAQKII
jgi:uncharacterized radical SAM superfamily Fe-S cluster-containing enzyme